MRARGQNLWRLVLTAYAVLVAPWPLFGIGVLLLTATGFVVPLVQIHATTLLLDKLAADIRAGHDAHDLLMHAFKPLLTLLGALFVGGLITRSSVQLYVFQLHAERVVARSMAQVFRKALGLRLEDFERPAYYDMLHRFLWSMQSSAIISNRLNRLQKLIVRLATGLGILWVLAQVHWLLAVVLALGCATIFHWRYRSAGHLIALTEAQTSLRRRQRYWQRLLTERSSAAEIRLFGIADHLLDRWQSLTEHLLDEVAKRRRQTLRRGVGLLLANLVVFGLVAGGLIVAADRGQISGGALVALLFAIQQFLDLLDLDLDKLRIFFNDLLYLPAFLGIAEGNAPQATSQPNSVNDGIVFDDVSFSYPDAHCAAVHNISLTIRPGERIALVGENGAGKSTLARLLLGLYTPTAGRITRSGYDTGVAESDSAGRTTSAVLQDFMRYPLTARDNIGFGHVDRLTDEPAIVAAAHASGARSILDHLPHHLDTLLTRTLEGGVDLSGGQWQSLAIARAHLGDAPIIVLDEPAAALDAQAERNVYAQFLQLAEGRTVLLISHRIGSARLADWIIVLRNGGIVEDGTHESLMQANGLYAELYALQAAWYQEELNDDALLIQR